MQGRKRKSTRKLTRGEKHILRKKKKRILKKYPSFNLISWNGAFDAVKRKLLPLTQKEAHLFENSNFSLSFKPFFLAQGLFVFSIILISLFVLAGIFSKTEIDQKAIVKNAVVKKTSAVVVEGKPISWIVAVEKKDILDGQYLLKVPKAARNIKVKTVSKEEAEKILSKSSPQAKNQLTLKDRQKIAGIFGSISVPTNPLAGLIFGVVNTINFVKESLLSSAEDAVDKVVEAIEDSSEAEIVETKEEKFVDLSSEVAVEPQEEESEIKEAAESSEKSGKELAPAESSGEAKEKPAKEKDDESKSKKDSESESKSDKEIENELEKESENIEPEEEIEEEISKEEETETETGAETETEAEVEAETKTTEPEEAPESAAPSSQAPVVQESPHGEQEEVSQGKSSQKIEETEKIEEPKEELILVEFKVPAPTITEEDNEKGKIIIVSSADPEIPILNALAFTKVQEDYKMSESNKIRVRWQNNGNQVVKFEHFDLNLNGKIDYIEWVIPNLFEEQKFSVEFKKDKLVDVDEIFDKDNLDDKFNLSLENEDVEVGASPTPYVKLNRFDGDSYLKISLPTKGISAEKATTEQLPADESLVEQTPAEETPVEEIKETLAEEKTTEESSIAETPVEEATTEKVQPEETIAKEKSAEEQPTEETPVEQSPIEETPVEQSPIEETPVEQSPIEETPIEQALIDNKEETVFRSGETLVAETEKEDIRFYPVFKDEESSWQEPTIQDQQTLRFVNLEGKIDAESGPATYEMFQKGATVTPTIISQWDPNDSFVFFGLRDIDRDLKTKNLPLPVARYYTSDRRESCPVIFQPGESYVNIYMYDPRIADDRDKYYDIFLEAINEAVDPYGIEIKQLVDTLYYSEGLSIKQLGRITVDGNMISFYLYLDSPLKNPLFLQNSRNYINLRDGQLMPFSGLREINSGIGHNLAKEIIQSAANKLGLNLAESNFTEDEQYIIDEIKKSVSSDDWKLNAERNDVSLLGIDEEVDKFEIDVVLKKKPESNEIVFDIETNNLEFYYQPELTEKEKEEGGNYRPSHVVGSYAVYHAEQDKVVKSKEEAERYGAGKAFHIYKPLIIDSEGNKIWGDLSIDKDSGKLKVTVPQEFLNTAVYPVTVDPTFGYSTIGGSTNNASAVKVYGSSFAMTSGENGAITSISVYHSVSDGNGSGTYKYVIYKHSDSTLFAQTSTGEVETTGWDTLSTATSPFLTSGTEYVIGFYNSRTASCPDKCFSLYYDAGAVDQGHISSSAGSYPIATDPETFTHDSTKKYSMYATYTTASRWDGGGTDNNWTTAANWEGDIAPVAGNMLIFAGSTRTSNTNDFSNGTSFHSIKFEAGGFTLSESTTNGITLTGGSSAINDTNTSGTNTINIDITFSTSAPTITTTSGGTLAIGGDIANGGLLITANTAGTLNLSGVISGTGGLTKSTGTGALTLSGANTYSGTTTLSAGTLNINNSTALGSGAFSIGATGTTIDNTSGGSITLSNNNTHTWRSFTFTGSNALNLGTGSVTLAADTTATISASTLTKGGTFSGSFTLTKQGSGTLSLGGTTSFASGLTATAGTLDTNGQSLTIQGNLTVNGGTLTGSAGTLDVDGNVSLSSGTLTAPSGTFTVGGNWTVSGTPTFTPGTNTVTFDATSTGKTITSNSKSFYNLTFNGSGGEWTLQDALDVDNNLTITAGTLDTNSSPSHGITVGGNWSNSDTFTARSGTVTMNGTSGTLDIISGGSSFYDLTLNDGGGTAIYEVEDAMDVDNNLTITGGTLDVKSDESNSITIGNNFTNSDTFTARSGTVTLDGTDQTITCGSSGTTFNNLTKTVTTAYTLTFTADQTCTVSSTLTLQGQSGALLSLRSSTQGTQWKIDPQGTKTVSYLDVKDSNNINSTAISCLTTTNNCTNSGNNTNWTFEVAATSTSVPRPPSGVGEYVETIGEIPGRIAEIPENILNQAKEVADQIRELARLLLPKEEKKIAYPPIEESVPKEAQFVFKLKWPFVLLPKATEFALAPLPNTVVNLAEKFPQIKTTLGQLNITKASDVTKMRLASFNLPNLSEILSYSPEVSITPQKEPSPIIVPGIPQAVPSKEQIVFTPVIPHLAKLPGLTSFEPVESISQLPKSEKIKIPSEIVFARVAGEKIDININVSITEDGDITQRINAPQNKELKLVVRPEKPAREIKGYLLFKSRDISSAKEFAPAISFAPYLTASLIGPEVNSESERGKENEAKELLLEEFDYEDDGDGIFTANIKAPVVDGEYEIKTIINYKDEKLGVKELNMIAVIDPEGYVFTKVGNNEARVKGAKVTLYWLNPETRQYEIWPAKNYQQENPQITDNTGKYAFLVPEGNYYMKVEASGYNTYSGDPFLVQQGGGIHTDIQMEERSFLSKLFSIESLLLAILSVLVIYGAIWIYIFYNTNKINKLKLKARGAK